MYAPNIHVERSFAEHDVISISDNDRTRRYRQKSPPMSFRVPYMWRIFLGALCGSALLFGGLGLCLLSYYSAFTTHPSNSTSNDTIVIGELMFVNSGSIRSCSIIGPVFMALGFFVVMIAYVIYMEFRDKYYRFLPTESIKQLPEKQVFALILQQFRKSYFHGIALPLGKPSAATNTYPAGILNTENTDELLDRLSPRFLKAEREADEALKIPHDSEVTLAYLAHVPRDTGKDSSTFSNAFTNKNIYSPFNTKKSYNKCMTQKSTLSLKNTDRRTTMLREFGERKSYSLDVPKPVPDGSHKNFAFNSDDDLAILPNNALRRKAPSMVISSDNESNLSDSRYPSVIVHEAAVHRRCSEYGAIDTSDDVIPPAVRRPSNFCFGGSLDAPNVPGNRRRSEYGVVSLLDAPKSTNNRRCSEYGVVGSLDIQNKSINMPCSETGVVGEGDNSNCSTSRRCSVYGVTGGNQESSPQYVTENSQDTDESSQGAYKTIINIAPSEMMTCGTFTGKTDRRKSLVSQCSVCNNDVLIDIDDYDKVQQSENNSISASKSSIDIYSDLLRRPSVDDRRNSFRNMHSKGSQKSLLDPYVDDTFLKGSQKSLLEPYSRTLERRQYGLRRVSFDPRTPTIERSRSCSSKLSIDESDEKFVSRTLRPGNLHPPHYISHGEYSTKNVSSSSIDRTVSPKRNFLSPNDSIGEYQRPVDVLSPLAYDNRQSTSDLQGSFQNSLDAGTMLSERRGSFDPRKSYAQSSASARRKSFVGSDSDSMEFRISIDRVDEAIPNRIKRRGRSLQVRSSRSNAKNRKSKQTSTCNSKPQQRSSITFKCGIEELRHGTFSMSHDDTEPLRKSANYLTPDYQPR